jgi:penicillin-binding protein 1A
MAAMAWKQFMTYAHQGIDLKPIPFIQPAFEKTPALVAQSNEPSDALARGSTLSAATSERLTIIEGLLRNAPRLKPLAMLPGNAPTPTEIASGALPN